MDLQNPENKMSKSTANPKGTVFLFDSDKTIAKKIRSAVTDSGSEVGNYEKASLGVKNLLHIGASVKGVELEEILPEFQGKSYGHLKVTVADWTVQCIKPVRERVEQLMKDKGVIVDVLKRGAEKANALANTTIKEVYETVGFVGHSGLGEK